MDGLEGDHGDLSDSDPPISSMRGSRSMTVRADLNSKSNQGLLASVEYSEEEDDNDLEAEDESDNSDWDNEDRRDVWSIFSKDLRNFETDTNIRHLYPPSLHTGWQPPIQPCDEYEVLERMLSTEKENSTMTSPESTDDQDQDLGHFQEFILRDFVIYESVEKSKALRGHMQTLDVAATEQNNKGRGFYFDGYLEHEGKRHYLQRVPIRSVNIGPLQDPTHHTTRDHLHIKSDIAQRLAHVVGEEIWYRLDRPIPEYSELFEKFIWVADLMKHFVDFLTASVDADEDVHLEDFRAKFVRRLDAWHANNATFVTWHETCGSTTDFSQYIARHASFLRDQVSSIPNQVPRLLRPSVWWEICPGKEFSQRIGPQDDEEQTVVTHNIMKGFLRTFPEWGPQWFNLLRAIDVDEPVEIARRHRMLELGFPNKSSQHRHYHSTKGVALTDDTLEKVGCAHSRPLVEANDVVGKIVVLRRNELDESDPEFKCSYAYVRSVVVHKRRQSLLVVWALPPRETMCHAEVTTRGEAHYGVGNELFFSDECCCKPVPLSNVIGVFGASILSDHADPGATFFIREKYFESESSFVTAKTSDLECSCPSSLPVDPHSDQSSPPITSECPKLQTLSLFSGCGLLDRGLEENGIIQTTCAIEIEECGVQTSLANQREKGKHLTASVNFCLHRWMRGLENFPLSDLLVAGCPCKGFSGLNMHSSNEGSQRNCSLLACTLSYVELLLPRYVLIENVPAMDRSSPACAQAICSLVEMGYQVRKSFTTVSACGGPQLRERLFIIAAAPGLPLPRDPSEFITSGPSMVSDAIRHLPSLDNDTTINLKFPDHIPLVRLRPKFGDVNLRRLVQKVPKQPKVGNLFETFRSGQLNHQETEWYLRQSRERRKKGTRAFGRINPSSPFPAMVTTVNPLDTRTGPFIHPYEDRVLSLEECKIAQGFPSDHVLIGSLAKQLKQIGNAVAWPVGVVLGRTIAESWREAISRGLAPTATPWPSAREPDEPADEYQHQDELDSITDQASVLAVDDRISSDTTLVKVEEENQDASQSTLPRSPAIVMEDSDSGSETPSQTSRQRSRLLSAFSAYDSPELQLRTELQAAVSTTASQAASSDREFSLRRNRTRTIFDSDDENDSADEVFAISSPAARRNMDDHRARKSARSTSRTLTRSSNTAEDPILLSD